MHKEICISVEPQETRVAILEAGRLQEYYVERQTTQRLAGNIYKGKVQSIAKGIGAAFVDIGTPKNGFLYVSDVVGLPSELKMDVELEPKEQGERFEEHIENLLKKDQEIQVQVTKEPLGSKGPRLTTKIALPGRYLVLVPTEDHIGISKRISSSKERDRLRDILKRIRLPKNMGIIVRTAAENKNKRDFIRDLRFLLNIWKKVSVRASKVSAPALLHQEHSLIFRILRDSLTEDVSRIVVDSKMQYREIAYFLAWLMPQMRSRLQIHKSPEPLFEKFHIESQIEKIYNRKISLKGGGYLVIEPTESVVAIDVNSGRLIGKKGIEETAFSVNMEAAKEIPRQIKLRDLGGIIIIDFIDMESAENRKKVFCALEETLKKDKAKVNILRISELGIVEMTRQRTRKPLESLSYQECPYCQGRGSTKSPVTMAINALRQLKVYIYKNKSKQVCIKVHPNVASRLFNEDRNSIVELERFFEAKIIIQPDPLLHIEQVSISPA